MGFHPTLLPGPTPSAGRRRTSGVADRFGHAVSRAARRALRLPAKAVTVAPEPAEPDGGAGGHSPPSTPPAHARRGILRADGGGAGRRHHAHKRVKWRAVVVGDDVADQERREKAEAQLELRERLARLERWSQIARLPALTYEELLIPVRVALPGLVMEHAFPILLDVIVDVYELVWMLNSIRVQQGRRLTRQEQQQQQPARAGAEGAEAEVRAAAASGDYTRWRIARDLGVIALLHAGRALYLTTGRIELFTAAQLFRCLKVRDLLAYMKQINSDLSTNVTFLAVRARAPGAAARPAGSPPGRPALPPGRHARVCLRARARPRCWLIRARVGARASVRWACCAEGRCTSSRSCWSRCRTGSRASGGCSPSCSPRASRSRFPRGRHNSKCKREIRK